MSLPSQPPTDHQGTPPSQPPTDHQGTPPRKVPGDTVSGHQYTAWGLWMRLLILVFWLTALIIVAISVTTNGHNTSGNTPSANMPTPHTAQPPNSDLRLERKIPSCMTSIANPNTRHLNGWRTCQELDPQCGNASPQVVQP
jgi:hypothetical protein